MTKPHRYTPRKLTENDAPTKAEHDAKVAATGKPYTQPSWDLLGRKPKEIKADHE